MDITDLRNEIDGIDSKMAVLFDKRMECVKQIALLKKSGGIPLENLNRESEMLLKNSAFVLPEIAPYYADFLKACISLSKSYQTSIISESGEDEK